MSRRTVSERDVSMKKRFFVLFISICLIMPMIVLRLMDMGLFAAGTIINSAHNEAVNSLQTGDQVHLGITDDDNYTVLNKKDGFLYLLKTNGTDNTPVNFSTAEVQANAYLSDANFGVVGKAHLLSPGYNVGLISKAELNALSVVSDDKLVGAVPSVTDKWWLADKDSPANRASYATEDNSFVGTNEVKTTVVVDGKCDVSSKTETGVLPIDTVNDPRVPNGREVASATLNIYHYGGSLKRTAYTSSTCSGAVAGSTGFGSATYAYNYSKDTNGRESWTRASGGALVASLIAVEQWRPRVVLDPNGSTVIQNASISSTRTKGTCYLMVVNNNSMYVDGTTSGNGSSYKPTGTGSVNASVKSFSNVTYRDFYCEGQTNAAGNALIRPYVKLKASDVIMRNDAKRAYAPTAVLSTTALPESDNSGSYLTLQTSKLNVKLNSAEKGVLGNVYEVEKPKNGTIISLPVYFGTDNLSEGARYVSAEAIDANGDAVYSVLANVGTGNTANVNINYANLLKADANSFKVTLYLEDGGYKNTAYRSNGTEITVKLKDSQNIRFDANTPGTLTYGSKLTVNAELYDFETDSNGDIKQSRSDLTFAIGANDYSKVYIESQTYDKTQGKGKVTIVPLTGTGSITLKISKNGDDKYFAAEEKTITIQLAKKPLTLVPSNPPGITAAIGDQMPSLEPEALILNSGDGLVSGDTVPVDLYPYLERVDSALAQHPAVNGVIENPGSWKLLFPDPNTLTGNNISQFLSKYDLYFEDYHDDNDHVFTVDPNGVLERWIEIYSPLPKVNDWYRAPVTLRPSQEAKYFGYFDIALVEKGVDGTFDSDIVFTDDTTGIKPIIKLKKNDGDISPAKQLNAKIKIDQTKPSAIIHVPSGWANLKKTINIQAIDLTSGIDTTDSNSVKVSYIDSSGNKNPITLNNTGGGSYSFDAANNGLYEIIVKDRAGNEITTFKNIQQIDTTPASITASLGNLSADGDYHDINVNRVEPDSGIDYIQVWYQGDGDTEMSLVGYLNRTLSAQTYQAQMNGRYEFRMKIGSGDILKADVLVADITQIRPVVGMNAINMGDNSVYIDNTWINQNVKVTLSNINVKFTDPVTYQYRKISDTNWIDLAADELEVTTNTWIDELYEFRAVSADVESRPVTLTVKIDKEKPQPPKMEHDERLSDNYEFIDKAEIIGHVIPKPSKIAQTWEYSLDDGKTWIPAVNDKIDLSVLGDYDLQVRTVDEAGNISDVDTYPVHIKGKNSQTIEFDEVPAFVTYGTTARITAKVTSDLSEQANTPLVFTIPSGSKDKMDIVQGYDPKTGEAWAELHPKNGDVFFDIEISKAGDDKTFAAMTKTKVIPLHKAPLTVHPEIIHGKVVGDVMPTLTSVGNGLVNNDSIPAALTINLTPDASTSDPLPTDSGNPLITHAGTWQMTYPTDILTSSGMADFVKKYDITLEDYNNDTDYVFTTADNGIPDSWVIVTPDPNIDGWNNTNVTISLADAAIAEGYTSLALIEHGVETKYGTSVLLDNETTGMTPVVVLKKPTETSGFKSLRYVKIDKSVPQGIVTIDRELDWTNTDKKVSIKVSDSYSGVKDVIVTDDAGNSITLIAESASVYTFFSDNEDYHLKVIDKADNVFEYDFKVERIDKTVPTIIANLGALSADKTSQDIDVIAAVGSSGVQSFNVYYKENASDAYPNTPIHTLDPTQLTCVYKAQKNGWYRFEIVNQVNQKAAAEVEVVDVAAAYPIIAIQAEVDDGIHTPYTSGKWVNKDINITLSNTNTAVTEAVKYQYKKIGDTAWTDITGNQFSIKESKWQNETYEFRGVVTGGEGGSTSIHICIDKEKPKVPTIENAGQFTADHAFGAPLMIKGSTEPKNSGIAQKIYVSKDHGITWEEMIDHKLTITQPDNYELLFKTVDEAGNESDDSKIHYVNVNDGTPLIEIKLNNNALKDILKSITFGYFFKDSVDVDVEVEWYGVGNGDIYYILDDSDTPSVPADNDPRWINGDHTTIDPDRKTMIYAKAVNSEGKTAMTSSTYFVYADKTAPEISFDQEYDHWINDNKLTASVTDKLSGVDNDSITAKIDHSNKGEVEAKGSSLNFKDLPDGSYKLQVSASDNSGNDTSETITVKIDTTAPSVTGVKDQSVYHQYYLPRYVSVEDKHSGVSKATISKNGGSAEAINDEIKVKDVGTYVIQTEDHAGNKGTLTFKIVPLPDINSEIDCGEESKKIIEQIENEYIEAKDQMDKTERENIQKWLNDAHDIRNTCRIKIVYNDDKSAWVEGIGNTDFAPDVIMVIEEITESSLPKLPNKAKLSYDVYLMQGNKIIEPNGKVRVHLPYASNDEQVILYEINNENRIKELKYSKNTEHLIFEANSLEKYAISVKNNNQGTNQNPDKDPDQKPDDNPDKNPDQKPDNDSDKTCKITVNKDTDGDGKPDINIDIDGDGKADLNIDTDCDGIPDINIDTDGDGKPDYNVDTDNDGEADINMGSLPKPWKPNKCVTVQKVEYCTMDNLRPHLNIDTDHDGRPDLNLDLDKDRLPDLNIDADGDLIPDVNIDTDGDGKPDINIDLNGDGVADLNLVRLKEWKPETDFTVNGFAYDTMSNLVPEYNIDTDGDGKADKNLVDNSNNRYNLSGSDGEQDLLNRVNTGDYTNLFMWILLFILAVLVDIYCVIKHRNQKRQQEQI